MKRGVRREQLALAHVEGLAAESGHDAAGLLDDQRPAAMSHGLSRSSQKPSNRPAAT